MTQIICGGKTQYFKEDMPGYISHSTKDGDNICYSFFLIMVKNMFSS